MTSYTLAQVIEGRRALICAADTDSVGRAIELMLTHRVAQLPVVDGAGALRGTIAQQTILSLYYYAGGQADFLRLPLAHCLDPAVTLTGQDDLLAAIDLLRMRGVYAVIVTEDERPVGILTGRDMTYFFRSLFEGTLMVEQIEVTLRESIQGAYPDEASRLAALIHTFGPSKSNKNRPARGQESLSFTDMLRVIGAAENWPTFEPMLGPKTLFEPMMERVRLVRNDLAHFQGRPDALELDALRRALLWLANRRNAPVKTRRQAAALPLPDVKLYPLSDILAQRKPPICVERSARSGDVLRLMAEYRFAQLPVVDKAGLLVGMVDQPTILSMYYFTKGDAPLLEMAVDHVMEATPSLSADDTFFQAVELLTTPGVAAAVAVAEGRPVGILTGKDMTHLFRGLFEGMILVERIEGGLREKVSAAFPDEDSLNAGAIAAFGPDPENPHYARRNPHRLSFGDRLLFISDDDNWPTFEPVLGPRVVFLHLMERVRQVRNELMHFNGQMDPLERDVLIRADSWLRQRPAQPDNGLAGSTGEPALVG